VAVILNVITQAALDNFLMLIEMSVANILSEALSAEVLSIVTSIR
jgi:hypothetical protein